MWKKMCSTILVLAGVLLMGATVWATNYSDMSTEELARLRGTMQNASQEERSRFRNEWRKRYQEMSPEERRQYGGPPEGAKRDGSGMGGGRQQGGGFGGGRGGGGRR